MKLLYRYMQPLILIGTLLVFLFGLGACEDEETPKFQLTVNSGTGSGQYEQGQVVNIAANTAPAGQEFDRWTGDVTVLADANSANTTVTMPNRSVTVTATYRAVVPTFTLTVNSGTGSGSYAEGTVVNIAANAAPAGQVFDRWTGDVARIANINAATTTLTMPAANTTVTATYKNVYTLTVTNGSGSGTYTAGQTVQIIANAAPADQEFDRWTGDVAALNTATNDTATVTMPAANVTLSATYKPLPVALLLAKAWKISKFYEKQGDNFVEIASAANNAFRLTLTADANRNPLNFSMELGSVLAVPNFNSTANEGKWSLNDPANPTQLIFEPDTANPSATTFKGSLSGAGFSITWAVPTGIAGKPERVYQMDFIPAQ